MENFVGKLGGVRGFQHSWVGETIRSS